MKYLRLYLYILTSSIVFCANNILGQSGYLSIDDEIYLFLNRMNTLGIIENYNAFELPKSREEIAKHLSEIFSHLEKLDNVDKNKLTDFLSEFEFDLSGTNNKSENLFPNFDFKYLINEKEKYLFSYSDENKNSFFLNFVGKFDQLNIRDTENDLISSAILYRFGGEIRGSLFGNIGFGISATNGSFSGNKTLAGNYSSLKYNYKFHQENVDNTGDNYFDETSAFAAYQNKYIKLKIGNDRINIGHGSHKVLLSSNAPRMDYLNLEATYKSLNFSYFHGKLLGNLKEEYDSIQGSINKVSDKFLAYHRLGLNLSPLFNFGIGEIIIYSNRNIDFSYLNPLSFYKSAEHSNQDRDNSMLFLDFKSIPIEGLKLYSTFLIDDIDFGKLGRGWYGNQTLLSLGLYTTFLYNYLPLDIELQYIKIDPYVYTHRILDNNFTNLGYTIGSKFQPNSSTISLSFSYRPHYRYFNKFYFLILGSWSK